jgi:ribonucleoside-diphosphate reductase alpha chain
MQVITRSGAEAVNFNKILNKLNKFAKDLDQSVDTGLVAQKTIERMVDGITTEELDNLSAGIAAAMSNVHIDYSKLAAALLIDRLHQNLQIKTRSFSKNIEVLYNHKINGQKSTRISKTSYDFVQKYSKKLDKIIDYTRDFSEFDYSAIQSFLKRGLEQIDNKPAETPQQMFLRCAIGINMEKPRNMRDRENFKTDTGIDLQKSWINKMTDEQRLEMIQEYYNQLSLRKISLPGPILLHAGSEYNQMASCYLQYVPDSLVGDEYNETGVVGGILGGVTQLAHQSKFGGGNAISITDLRGTNSVIRKTNGKSNGILPFMKMFDSVIGAINQSGKRAGTCAVYIEPWHADILEYLDAGNHFTIEEKRCKNLFYGLWMNDLFFQRLTQDKADAKWTLFDPGDLTNYLEKPLSQYYGKEFEKHYQQLEAKGVGKTIPLMEIWSRICNLWQTTGMPYMLNKDKINETSNQKNIGTVSSSNLCTEITLVSNPQETAVCVLSSVCLARFVNTDLPEKIDYDGIIHTARIATRHLNNVIDIQYYPTPETRNSCLMRRAIGVGAQGLADVFHMLRIGFTSPQAQQINKNLYEAIYYGCLKESMELAKTDGAYTGFLGSPASKGELQFDMWGIDQNTLHLKDKWVQLKKDIIKYGLRNSEVTALAPTASSSVRMGNNEMHEPFTRNVYVRQTIAGSLQIVNQYLVKELGELGLWNQDICNQVISQDGSVQGIAEIPVDIQERYRTVYELDWQELVDMMADRSPFVSQSSSYNHYTTYGDSGPTAFTQKIIYAWKKGLKTLSYYQHTETATTAKKELGGISSNYGRRESDIPTTKDTPSTKPTRWTPDINPVQISGVETVVMGEVCEDCST